MSDRRVRFSVPHTIHQIEYSDKRWETASRLARDGSDWLRMGLDRQRFRDRIERTAEILDKILDPELRQTVYQERFEDFVPPTPQEQQQATEPNNSNTNTNITTTTTTPIETNPTTSALNKHSSLPSQQSNQAYQQNKRRRRHRRKGGNKNQRKHRGAHR